MKKITSLLRLSTALALFVGAQAHAIPMHAPRSSDTFTSFSYQVTNSLGGLMLGLQTPTCGSCGAGAGFTAALVPVPVTTQDEGQPAPVEPPSEPVLLVAAAATLPPAEEETTTPPAAVPEPTSIGLLGLGLLAYGRRRLAVKA